MIKITTKARVKIRAMTRTEDEYQRTKSAFTLHNPSYTEQAGNYLAFSVTGECSVVNIRIDEADPMQWITAYNNDSYLACTVTLAFEKDDEAAIFVLKNSN